MKTQKHTSEIIKIAVSDYLGATVRNGQLHLVPYTVIDPPQIDAVNFSGSFNVHTGATKDYIVPPGMGIRIEATKTSTGDSFRNSIEVNCSDAEFPNIIADEFEGTFEYYNDSAHERILTFRCVPIFAHENSAYNITTTSLYSRLGRNLRPFTDTISNTDYKTGSQLVMLWDMFRHPTVVLNYKVSSDGETPFAVKRVVDSWQGDTFFFPKRYSNTISNVKVSVDIKLNSLDGEFAVFPTLSKISTSDLSILYSTYEQQQIAYDASRGVVSTATTNTTNTTTTATSSGTTTTATSSGTSGTSGGY